MLCESDKDCRFSNELLRFATCDQPVNANGQSAVRLDAPHASASSYRSTIHHLCYHKAGFGRARLLRLESRGTAIPLALCPDRNTSGDISVSARETFNSRILADQLPVHAVDTQSTKSRHADVLGSNREGDSTRLLVQHHWLTEVPRRHTSPQQGQGAVLVEQRLNFASSNRGRPATEGAQPQQQWAPSLSYTSIDSEHQAWTHSRVRV